MHKKFAFVGAAVLLATYATHFLHCCNLCFTIDPAPKLHVNATIEEKLVAAGSQIEDALLLAQTPLRYCSRTLEIGCTSTTKGENLGIHI